MAPSDDTSVKLSRARVLAGSGQFATVKALAHAVGLSESTLRRYGVVTVSDASDPSGSQPAAVPGLRAVDAYSGSALPGFSLSNHAGSDNQDGALSALETVQQLGVASMTAGQRRHTSEEWRDGLKSFLRHRIGYSDRGAHPAQVLFHARNMVHSLTEMATAAPDDPARKACVTAAETIEDAVPDLEYARASAVDDLPSPAPAPPKLHDPMPYEAFDHGEGEFVGTALHELYGLTAFVGQGCVAAVESDAWRAERDEFLKHYSHYEGDGLTDGGDPALTLYHGERMREAFDKMAALSTVGSGHESYIFGQQLLSDLVESDAYDCASFDFDDNEWDWNRDVDPWDDDWDDNDRDD